jgi:carbamoyl-phosphate synthase large subunit
MTNVLLLSAGRRVELLEAFRRELSVANINSALFAVDMRSELSAACNRADFAISSPAATESDYCNFLVETIEANDIRLVIPTIDAELEVLADLADELAAVGAQAVISDRHFIELCQDKRKTVTVFDQIGIGVPKIFDDKDIAFPCFSKPFNGSSSRNARLVQNKHEYTTLSADPSLMFMEYMDSSFVEITVDAYFDKLGELKCMVPRRRIEVRAGEVSKAITQKEFIYDFLIDKVRRLRGARGCITVQLFFKASTEEVYGIEINPRFGGGFPLSYAAGANFPRWLIGEYLLGNRVAFFDEWQENLLMLRYDASVIVNG